MTTPERDPNPPAEVAGWHDPACGCDACEEDWARKRADEREPDARDHADEPDSRNEWEV